MKYHEEFKISHDFLSMLEHFPCITNCLFVLFVVVIFSCIMSALLLVFFLSLRYQIVQEDSSFFFLI